MMKNYQAATMKNIDIIIRKTSQKFPLRYFTDLDKLRWYNLPSSILAPASLCHISHKRHPKRHLSKPLMTSDPFWKAMVWDVDCMLHLLNSDRGIPPFPLKQWAPNSSLGLLSSSCGERGSPCWCWGVFRIKLIDPWWVNVTIVNSSLHDTEG